MSWLAWLLIGVLVGTFAGFVVSVVFLRKQLTAEIIEVAALTERIEAIEMKARTRANHRVTHSLFHSVN